jgi:hypothetical protein
MPKLIPLTKNQHAIVDDEDYDFLMQWKWECDPGTGMVRCRQWRGQRYAGMILMHRLITNAPAGMQVDHINHNRLDNRHCNLRVCTHQENNFNRRSTPGSSSQFKGVSWSRRRSKWHAVIDIDKKTRHIGYFTDEVEAAKAYDRKAKEHFGDFAYLNFPDLVSA